MTFDLTKTVDILRRTPEVLITMLSNLSSDWTSSNEGGETWSAYDVIGHLIHGEKTDWIPRMEIILSDKENKTFEPFNRFAQFDESKEVPLTELLHYLKQLRSDSIDRLLAKRLTDKDLHRTGMHPVFGEVTLAQLLSTWTVHDLNHIGQISRVLASQYKTDVGPWTPYLRILHS